MKIFRKRANNNGTRRQWVKKILGEMPAGKKILDVGAGECQYKKFCPHLNYISHDFCQYDGEGNKKALQSKKWNTSKIDIVSDIVDIPVRNNSFDIIICTEVFEHIPEPVKAVKEFSRILKPGGKLILTAPFCSLTHQAPYYFANGYSKYWYKKILGENGFTIDEVSYNGNYFEYLAQEIRRISVIERKYTDLKVCRKLHNWNAKRAMLKLLKQLSKNNKGSEELLCFGLHVLAAKK